MLGGEILEDDESPIDSSIEFCKEHYQESNWLDTDDINLEEPDCYLLCCLDDENYTSAQYFTFSSMTEAKEFCYQFAKENYPDEDLQFKENSFYHEDGHKMCIRDSNNTMNILWHGIVDDIPFPKVPYGDWIVEHHTVVNDEDILKVFLKEPGDHFDRTWSNIKITNIKWDTSEDAKVLSLIHIYHQIYERPEETVERIG